MSDDDKPGWFGRLFGRRAEDTPKDAPGEAGPPPPPEATAFDDGQGTPDFTTAEVALSEAQADEADSHEAWVRETWVREALARDVWDPAIAPLPGDAVPETAGADLQPIEPDPEPEETTPEEPERKGWWRRLTEGMRRTSSALSDRVTGLFTKRKLDATTLEELEDALIQADFGIDTATRMAEAVGKDRYDRNIDPEEVRGILAQEIERALAPVAVPLVLDAARKPHVILMVGVNGAGKTTTIGKLAQKFQAQGHSVMLAAGDTFRAAAIEQLRVWGERTGTTVVSGAQGADAAGLAYDAFVRAKAEGTDVLLIDTAGRLQNKAGLMAELEKIVRVVTKLDPEAPHTTLLVLDATVGQNALSQVELFRKVAGVTGLVMTKLDGTARGGILVALAAKFGLPVHFIGVGEGVDDLEPFAARDFARAIVGLEEEAA